MTLPLFNLVDDGTSHVFNQLDQFAIELDETPTTGYRWHVEFSDELTLLSCNFAVLGSAISGAGGRRRWVFLTKRAGVFSIKGKLWREWMGEGSVISRFGLTVQVLE